MSEKLKWLEKYAPLGINVATEVGVYIAGVVIATLQSTMFFVNYGNATADLYTYRLNKQVLIEGAIIKEFQYLLENVFLFSTLVCIATLLVTIFHYMYHYEGSKMMYLMKRLPDKWEVHRRCWTLPVAGAVLMVVWMQVLKMFYYAVYILCTPSQCLPL